MKAQNFFIPFFITFLFLACDNNKKKIEVVDLSLEQTVIDTPPPPPPPYDMSQAVKRFKEYTLFKKADSVNVYAPVTKPSNRNIKDPAFLIINILYENYSITFLNQTLSKNNISDLEAFLQKNKHG